MRLAYSSFYYATHTLAVLTLYLLPAPQKHKKNNMTEAAALYTRKRKTYADEIIRIAQLSKGVRVF